MRVCKTIPYGQSCEARPSLQNYSPPRNGAKAISLGKERKRHSRLSRDPALISQLLKEAKSEDAKWLMHKVGLRPCASRHGQAPSRFFSAMLAQTARSLAP